MQYASRLQTNAVQQGPGAILQSPSHTSSVEVEYNLVGIASLN